MEHQIGISFPDRVVLRLKCDTESPGWGGGGALVSTRIARPQPQFLIQYTCSACVDVC